MFEKESKLFKEFISSSDKIRIISHFDADGISSASLLFRYLATRKQISIKLIKQLDKEEIEKVKNEASRYDLIIFSDLGSGQLKELKDLIESKKVIILDHHQIQNDFDHPNLLHINPYYYGIDGSKEVTAAGVVYLVLKNLSKLMRKYSYLPIVAAIGDRQEDNGLIGLNKKILKDAIEEGIIRVKKGLRIYGRVSKPIFKALAYSTNIFIPGVTGNESAAIQFLSNLGIKIKKDDRWRRIVDLSREEEKKLITAIVLRNVAEGKDYSNILGNIYEIRSTKLIEDCHEFATLLNAAGRIGDGTLGIMLAVGDSKALSKVNDIFNEYRKQILKGINFVYSKLGDKNVVLETANATYIFGKNNIKEELIGTICSILSSSNTFSKDTIVGFANSSNGVKVSVRTKNDKINVGLIVAEVARSLNGEGGGHKKAGGAKIPKDTENLFIEKFEEKLNEINKDVKIFQTNANKE